MNDERPEYVAVEFAILRERQRAISASAYTSDDGRINVLVLYPISENNQKTVRYIVDEDGKFARAEKDMFTDVILLK